MLLRVVNNDYCTIIKLYNVKELGLVMSAYEEGSMDISEHQRTWNGFVKLVQWGIISCVALLVFMAIFLV